MMRSIITALRALVAMTVLTGIVYPLLVMAVGHFLFPYQATGSLITVDGKIAGSALVGQRFADSSYFWSRPSVTDYNAFPSGASNLGPTSAALKDSVTARRSRFLAANGESATADFLCASASGLDPDISPEGARRQLGRIERVRHLDPPQKKALLEVIERSTETPELGIFGQPRVNVLRLNLALDSLSRVSH
jgi:K+-transporting ATPase ATPase C chain